MTERIVVWLMDLCYKINRQAWIDYVLDAAGEWND